MGEWRIGILGCLALVLSGCAVFSHSERTAELQQTIADTAGEAPLSRITPFEVGSGSARVMGSVEAVREFGSQLRCREIVYELGSPGDERRYTATICRGPAGWRWAVPEPAAGPLLGP